MSRMVWSTVPTELWVYMLTDILSGQIKCSDIDKIFARGLNFKKRGQHP